MRTTTLDKLCRIVIPVDYRNALQIGKGSVLTMCMENGAIVIRPANGSCRICGGEVEAEAALPLCPVCIQQVKKL